MKPTSPPPRESIAAIVLAAGQSRRMGRPKLTLPWGSRTVIEQVIHTLIEAGIQEIVVVSGGNRELLEEVLAGYPVKLVYNPDYQQSEMTVSLQTGIRQLAETIQAFLVVLGDQPAIHPQVIRRVVERYLDAKPELVIPSYHMRRGHPWLVDRGLWPGLLALPADQTMRDFINQNQQSIVYEVIDDPGILTDIDTPEDYQRYAPDP